jgi:hypothetical protein
MSKITFKGKPLAADRSGGKVLAFVNRQQFYRASGTPPRCGEAACLVPSGDMK